MTIEPMMKVAMAEIIVSANLDRPGDVEHFEDTAVAADELHSTLVVLRTKKRRFFV